MLLIVLCKLPILSHSWYTVYEFLRGFLTFLWANFRLLPRNSTCALLNPFKYMTFDHPVSSFDAKYSLQAIHHH